MSYNLFEDFSVKNISGGSYFFGIENETRYSDLHGVIKDGRYLITTDSSKHLLKSPELGNFSLSFEMRFVKPCTEIKKINFIFGYNRVTRTGYSVKFSFVPNTNGELNVSLVSINGICETVLNKKIFGDFLVEEEKDFFASLNVSGQKVSTTFGDLEVDFSLPNTCSGLIGISDCSAVGGIAISNLSLTSKENPEFKTILKSTTLKTSVIHGTPEPFYIKMEILRTENCAYDMLNFELFGGIGEQNDNVDDVECWLFEADSITSPFLRLITDKSSQKINIWNSSGTFTAQNEFPGVLTGYRVFDESREYPFKNSVPIEPIEDIDNLIIGFGYDLISERSFSQSAYGGKHEFLFNTVGDMLWDGGLLDEHLLAETKSSADKRIVSLIPKDIPRYKEAVNHAIGNHYFFDDEQLDFELHILTKYPSKAIRIEVRIESVYGEKISDVVIKNLKYDQFLISDYELLIAEISKAPMQLGVYHLVYDVFMGSEKVYTHTSAFEVFSKDESLSPQAAVGLPEIHAGDGGPLFLKSSIPDPWNECRDNNVEHYYGCAMYQPNFAENSRVWELLKIYRRKWFLWFNQRTIGRKKNYKDFPNCIKNADYINYLYPMVEESLGNWCRHDMWRYSVYTSEMIAILAEFLKENPDIAMALNFGDVTKEYTEKMHRALFDNYSEEWLKYATKEIAVAFEKQWDDIRKINPLAKHSSYGPIPFYSSAYKTAYSTKFFAQDPFALDKVFDGFWQFEDYPTWCNYPFGIGAFSLMSYKLYSPNAVIRPEIYATMKHYCPDGFVGLAHPTRELYRKPGYVQMSQILEYAYNTAYFKNGRFDYWRDNQYMMQLFSQDEDESVSEFLKAQRKIVKYKPSAPKKSVVFVVDFNADEDVLDHEIHHDSIYNKSESNICYLNEICRKSGVPVGAGTDFEGLLGLSAEQIDVLVLPSLKHATNEVINHIIKLYENGVALFATGDVTGLEDIFGVSKNQVNAKIYKFVSNNAEETVLPVKCEFGYESNGAEVLLLADEKHPVLLKNNRAVLLNTCVSRAGIDSYNPSCIGRPNINKLLVNTCVAVFRDISNPLAISDVNSGLVVFEGTDGADYLFVSDLSSLKAVPLDFEKPNKILVEFNQNIKGLLPLELDDDKVIEFSQVNEKSFGVVELLPMQSKLFKIEKQQNG